MASARKDNPIIRFWAGGLRLSVAVVVAVVSALGAGGAPVALAAGADNIGSATDISASLPIVNDATSNTTATRDLGELGTCGAFPSAPSTANTRSLWYRYTAGSSGWFTVHTRGSTYDTVLEVYTSTVPSPAASDLISVACNDDIDAKTPVRQSQVMLPVTAATTYYIAIRSYGISAAVGTALFSASFAAQQHLYVSSTGDDSNIGSADAPFRTIQRAVDGAATNGDGVIHVLDTGPYDATTINKSLTLTSTVAATAPGFTLTNGAVLGSGTGGITAPTVSVDQLGAPGAKIQDGVLLAASGGTVNVGAGTYTQTVTINQNLTLQGASGAVIQVTGGTALTLSGGAVTVNDFSIQGSTLGVSITGGSGHVLFHDNITGNTSGVSNASGSAVTATSNYWGSSTGPAHPSNAGGVGNSVTNDVTFTPWCTVAAPTCTPLAAIPTQLVFMAQPGNSSAGVAFPAQPVLRAQDASGNLGINFNSAVTMTIGTNPGGGSLSGANPVTAANGTSTFGDLSINLPGVGYTLVAAATLPGGITSTTSISFTVFNNAPVATDDIVAVLEDSGASAIGSTLLANDTDDCPSPPGPPASNCIRFTAVTAPANGVTAIIGGGAGLTYTPNANFFGTNVFTYTINDIYGSGTDTAVVTLTVTNVNDPPDAINDSFTVTEDSLNNPFDVRANDSFAPDPPETLTVTAVGAAASGTVLFNSTVVTYTPNANFFGTDVFTYTVSDGNGGLDTASITVTVTNVNDPVTAADDADATNEDTAKVIGVLTNDRALNIDGSTEPITVTAVGPATSGTASITGGGANVTYTPASNFSGTAVFTYTVSDSASGATATVTVTVNAVNDPPNATNDTATTNENTPVGVNVTANDSDVDGSVNAATLSIASGPTNGTVITNATGVITYTPTLSFNGTDTFQYSVCDTGTPTPSLCDTAIVTVTVNGVNDSPQVVDNMATTNEDIAVGIDVTGNDSDIESLINLATLSIASGPSSGTVITNATGVITYTPALNFSGTDTFQYSVCDSGVPLPALCGTATVTVTVNAVNDPPNAASNTATTNEDTSVGVNVTANDSDVDGGVDAATLNIASGPSNGTVITNATGVITYTPVLNFNGADTFQYSVCDTGTPLPPQCNTAVVTITVTAVNDPLVAADDTATVLEDSGPQAVAVLPNDMALNVDVGEVLTITSAGPAGNGTVITGTTVVTYTPSADFFGTDTFTYTVTDGGYTATALITVTVTPVNDPPSFVKGPDVSVPEDSGSQTYLNWAPFASISPGAPNESGQTLTFVVTNTNNSLFSVQPALNSANGALTFTPAPNAFGSVTVFATLTDNGGTQNGGQDTSPTQSFLITITPANDPPTAANDAASLLPDSGANAINVLANDTFSPDLGETLVITQVMQGMTGAVAITGGGTGLTYTPNPGFVGVDTFTYTISDGNGGVAAATVTVTVAMPNATIYLPLVMNNMALLPDLVASFSLNPANPTAGQSVMVTVVITNQGSAGTGPFWADFYINPSVPPTGPNVPWNAVSSYGIAWYVPASLGPGQSLTLTSISGGYCAPPTPGGSTPGAYCDANTIWPGAFASGAKDLYLFVDSWNPTVATGAVAESDETNNRAERHFPSPLAGAADFDIQTMDVRRPEDLPERPRP